jgi:hypothetical protein
MHACMYARATTRSAHLNPPTCTYILCMHAYTLENSSAKGLAAAARAVSIRVTELEATSNERVAVCVRVRVYVCVCCV